MDRIGLVEAQLENLQEVFDMLNKRNESADRTAVMDDAKFLALYSMVQDLAVHAGVDLEDLQKHYATRLHFWKDYRLKQIENTSSDVAARLDNRPLSEVPTRAVYPDLFDPPLAE